MNRIFRPINRLINGQDQIFCILLVSQNYKFARGGSCTNNIDVRQRRNSISRNSYVFPTLSAEDLEEQFVKGHGPGGSHVNTTENCIVLKHKPTGLVVKSHHSRSLDENRRTAWKLMQEKLDRHLNGENSFLAQKEREQKDKESRREHNKRLKREKSQAFKEIVKKWNEEEKITTSADDPNSKSV